MRDRSHVAALAGAFAILVALDTAIARVDVFRPLLGDTRPTSLFGTINYEMAELVQALHGLPAAPARVVVLGNSQMEAAVRPLGGLAQSLVAAGAPRTTEVVSLCVFATAPTDAEVVARGLRPVHPWLVILGIAPPDVGTTLERAREMPITRALDVGLRDGLVPPADTEARLDRWVRTVWRLYRYRTIFHGLLVPPEEHRTPAAFLDARHTPAEIFAVSYGPEQAAELLRLRAAAEQSGREEDIVHYVEVLRGPDYLPGLRARWQELAAEPLQVEALRRFAVHARDAGGTPVWVLLPENPFLARDPEVGTEVIARSDEIAARLAAEARSLDVPILDLRHALPASAFFDLNHLVPNGGDLAPVLSGALARDGLLREARTDRRAPRV